MLFGGYIPAQAVNHIPVTQSVLGQAVPIVFGTARVPAILVWRGDLEPHAEASAAGSKAKGGKNGQMYAYTASFIGVLAEGPILGVERVWSESGQLPTGHQTATLGLLPTPAAPTLTYTAGGSLAATTYYVTITYTDANGESAHSAEASIAVPASNLLVVDTPPTAAPDANGWNVYAATASGSELLQTSSPVSIGSNWTEPTSGLLQNMPPHPQHLKIVPPYLNTVQDRGFVHPTLGVFKRVPY